MNLKSLAAALLVGVSSTAAMAADLPSRKVAPAPVYAAPMFTWTGFYVGLQAGIAWDKLSGANNGANAGWLAPAFPVATTVVGWGVNNGANTKSGFIGGAHLGYNWQMSALVLGLEGDLEGASVWSGSLRGSIRGRLGFAVDRVLFYGTGGFAFLSRSGSNNYGAWGYNWGGNTSSSRTGWTVGAGLEYAFSQNWSAGLEYRYAEFSGNSGNTGYFGYNWGGNTKVTENAVRARVSYHFGAPAAPVVAKY